MDRMKHLDLQVIQQGIAWLEEGRPVWLSTVLATFGSAPRGPGSMLVAASNGESRGSLSGGCVEEDFLERVSASGFSKLTEVVRYGEGGLAPNLALPCGGALDVLVEHFTPGNESLNHFQHIADALSGSRCIGRVISVGTGIKRIVSTETKQARVTRSESEVTILVGPAKRLIVAGFSPVAEHCAIFAVALGFEVIVCDPRPEQVAQAQRVLRNVQVLEVIPALFIEQGGSHAETAIVALTHDPRLDDLTLMESIRTEAFYIGAMGSTRTSIKRLERLARIGGFTHEQKQRIHAPIGLNLGSKTPAEIAIAVMADVIRVGNGVLRDAL
ncbi:hypothetical protein ALQ24_03177 [Pseudomonas syringae pv. antirrhini]|uniref:Xanthine dehydrogenase accessory factor XdhC n=2 Tax=Pseudomonas TaxID=286 RepID=A0A0P9P7D7_9PSED|nr:Uncharacterized protein ALO88_00013 [Pseudomonas syringae pv. antirrhini]RMP32105.1 hypothetical protein ALQ24_03177 [Pseudomonas syringae pv. antirrhini]